MARRSERGAVVVEFALVVLIVLLAVLGIIQYGYHFWSLETGAATAREAARRMAVGTGWECTRLEGVAHASGPAVGSTAPSFTVRYSNAASSTVSAPVVGGFVSVTVTFQSLDLGLFPLPANGLVTETARARVENVPPASLSCL